VSPTTTWPASTASGTPRSRGKDKTSDGPHRVLERPRRPQAQQPGPGMRGPGRRRGRTDPAAAAPRYRPVGAADGQDGTRRDPQPVRHPRNPEETGVTVAFTGILGIYSDPAHRVGLHRRRSPPGIRAHVHRPPRRLPAVCEPSATWSTTPNSTPIAGHRP
jgi:hypothetical protein